jgi:hypothetical protein
MVSDPMKRLLLSAVAALALCGAAKAQIGPPNQVQCNQFVSFTGTGAAALIMTGAAGKTIFICGWHVTSTSNTTTTFQLTAGTGATCGTGTITVTPALNVTITAPSADHIDFASLSYAGPNNICVNAPASITGGIWAGQY